MSDSIKIAVDAMGGDGSPKKIIDGIILNNKSNKNIFYKIFGDENQISGLIKNKVEKEFYEIIHTDKIIKSTDSPLEGAKRGKETSMWLAIQSVKEKKADIVISAGNTGALLVVAKLNLKMIENIDKPALSALWPNKKGMSVVLDLGANIECSSKNLIDFSIMGASLYTSLYPDDKPNVALLNIGSEELKGNETIKETFQILNDKNSNNYNFAGYIEGNHLMDGDVNVIVSDGFTGNVALKTAEGTANMVKFFFKNAFESSLISKMGYFLASLPINTVKQKLDPSVHNCGIFIGLSAPVIKCHGNSNHLGISYASDIAYSLIEKQVNQKVKMILVDNKD